MSKCIKCENFYFSEPDTDDELCFRCEMEEKDETIAELNQQLQQYDTDIAVAKKRIKELKKQLKNAIVPKFKIGQIVWFNLGFYNKGKYSGQFDYYEQVERKIERLDFSKYGLRYLCKDVGNYGGNPNNLHKFRQDELFATKEEAEQRLKELRNE